MAAVTLVRGTKVRHRYHGSTYTGTVTGSRMCKVLGRRVRLYSVVWDGKPLTFPYSWKDEGSTGRFAGYRVSELKVVR